MLEWLALILLPYLKTCQTYLAGGYAILILDQADTHKTDLVKMVQESSSASRYVACFTDVEISIY